MGVQRFVGIGGCAVAAMALSVAIGAPVSAGAAAGRRPRSTARRRPSPPACGSRPSPRPA